MSKVPRVADLAWFAGTWRASVGEDVVEEIWSEPLGPCAVGVLRWMRGEGVHLYEILALEEDPQGVAMRLRHFSAGLEPSSAERDGAMTWRLASQGPREAVFASDRTAFPRRIVYRRVADDVLVARLEGQDEGTPAAMEFRFTRC